MKLNVGDVEISISPNIDGITNYGKSILFRDMLFVCQLDEDVLNLINDTGELHDKVNSMVIVQLPIEKSYSKYYEDLVDLIKYIIFHNDKINIVYDGLWICNTKSKFYELSVKAVEETQRKITKNQYKLFPVVNKTCFNRSLSELNFTMPLGENTTFFAEISGPVVKTIESEILPLDYDITDGWKYIEVFPPAPEGEEGDSSSSASTVPLEPIGYQRIDTEESYTMDLRGMYSQILGNIASSVGIGNVTVTIKRIANPDIYGKVQDELLD